MQEYDALLKELRALPNPSDNVKDAKSTSSDDTFLKNVRGDLDFDDDEGDIEVGSDSKNGKKSKSGLAGLSTTQAVDLIRSILNNASRKPEARAAAALLEDFDDDDEEEDEEGEGDKAESKFDDHLVSTKIAAAPKTEPDDAADEKPSNGNKFKRDASKKDLDDQEDGSSSSDGDKSSGAKEGSASTNSPKRRNPNLSLTIEDNDAEGAAMEVVDGESDAKASSSEAGSSSTALVVVPEAASPNSNRIAVHPGGLNRHRYENPSADYGPPAALSGSTMTCKLKDHR